MTPETPHGQSTGCIGRVVPRARTRQRPTWKLAFAVTHGHRPRIVKIPARQVHRLHEEIAGAKARLGSPRDAGVRSCYEAGRDGFWLHRALMAAGIENVVVDPSSIAVDRRARRAKTDRIDATKLVTQLMNAAAGDRRGWREVRVPSVQAEADRHLQREWETVREDRKRIRNRIQGLLVTHGRPGPAQGGVWCATRDRARVGWQRAPRGVDRPPGARVDPAATGRSAADDLAPGPDDPRADPVGYGGAPERGSSRSCAGSRTNGALTLTTELFAWRGFTNGRQIGAIVGLTPTPYRSDQTVVEQGISRSGNRRVRALSIELAWAWLRYQPTSALSRWFDQRFGQHGRARRIGIVARGAQAADCLLALSGPGHPARRRPGEGVTDASIRSTDRDGAGARRSLRVRVSPRDTGATEGAARPCSRPASRTHEG